MKSVFKLSVIFIVLLLLVTTAACSSQEDEFDLSLVFGNIERGNGHNRDTADSPAVMFDWLLLDNFNRNVLMRPERVVSPFYGETLTILVERDWHMRYRLAQMAESFKLMHPGVNVEFVFADEIGGDGIETAYFDDLMDIIFTDHAPVLIQGSTVRYPFHEHNDFFADWMPILARHSGFDENEWNMNVLSASLINNELIAFPASQNIRFFSANRTISGLAELFYMRDGITMNELLDLYISFEAQNDGFSIAHGFLSSYIIIFHLHEFFDYGNRRVEFYSEEFIELLERLFFEVSLLDFIPFQTAINNTHYTVRGAFAVDLVSRDLLF